MNNETRNEVFPARQSLNINWGTGTFLVVAHAAAVAALFFWSWPAVISAVILYWVAGSLGIGMGFHRLIFGRYSSWVWLAPSSEFVSTGQLPPGNLYAGGDHRR